VSLREKGQHVEAGNEYPNLQLFPRAMTIVKSLTGKSIVVDVTRESTTHDLKANVYRVEGIPIDQQRIVFACKQLEDDRMLGDYNVTHGSSLHLVLKLGGC
jgi:hypothetical protein